MDERAELLDRLKLDGSDRVDGGGRSWLWLLGGAGFLAAGAAVAWLVFALPAAPLVRVAIAEPVGIEVVAERGSALDASGYVVARRQATVSSKITGKVVDVLIEEGQYVREQEVIARLDDTNALAAVRQAEAQLAQARASFHAAAVALDNSRPIFERQEAQFVNGFVSAEALDNARASHDATRTALEVAARAVDVAAANLELSRRGLDDTVVRAPFAGVVTVKAAQEGEMVSPVSAGGGFTRTGIGTIVDMESLEVEVDVNESFINRVSSGQDVSVKLNAYPDWEIPASVIAIIPTADRAKATVRVRVGLAIKDPRVLPQMGVRVSFLTENVTVAPEHSDSRSVVVPRDAVEGSGDTGVVYLLRDGRLERRAVRLGALTASGQIVTAGLTPGVKLAAGDLHTFADGLKVRPELL